jgi:hypothetical protein
MDNLPKEFEYTYKPDWKVILEQVVLSDLTLLNRIVRRIIIHLHRKGIKEIIAYRDVLIPNQYKSHKSKLFLDMAADKESSALQFEKISKIFVIADKYCSDSELNTLLYEWIHQENVNNISMILEKRSLPFSDVVESVKKYLRITAGSSNEKSDSRIGLRVSLIQRLLSENLNYINIAKNYLSLQYLDKILENIIATPDGAGKVGGKSAGVILAGKIIDDLKEDNPKLEFIKTPKCWFVASDVILEFMAYNALEDFVYVKYNSSEEIQEEYEYLEYIFINSEFPSEFVNAINKILDEGEGTPLIIRSSSLLEDSFEASFSGKYKSIFVPNCGTKIERLHYLLKSVAEVYASAFAPDPLNHRIKSGLIDFPEEMGILIQEVVGKKYGKYYLPCFSGSACSINDQPWSPRIRHDDGLVKLVLGLGTRTIDLDVSDYPKLFAPGNPNIRINNTFEEIRQYSQSYLDVINLETNKFESIELVEFLKYVNYNFPYQEKIFSFVRNETVVDPITSFSDFSKEDILVTFNNLINHSDFVEVINEILKVLKTAYNRAVDIEFAFDGENLYLLQCRPYMQNNLDFNKMVPHDLQPENILFSLKKSINTAFIQGIQYIVYIDINEYHEIEKIELINEIKSSLSILNSLLPEKKYILIAPGRLGGRENTKSSIPVQFKDINNSALIVELSKRIGDKEIEVSYGSHFFLDLIESNIKCLPIFLENKSTEFNFSILSKNSLEDFIINAEHLQKYLKVIDINKIKPSQGLNIFMDSHHNKAIAYFS